VKPIPLLCAKEHFAWAEKVFTSGFTNEILVLVEGPVTTVYLAAHGSESGKVWLPIVQY
jgi:hypothetical protein